MQIIQGQQPVPYQSKSPALRWAATYISSGVAAFRARRDRRTDERFIKDALMRLGEISPHLLTDIGVGDLADYPESYQKQLIAARV